MKGHPENISIDLANRDISQRSDLSFLRRSPDHQSGNFQSSHRTINLSVLQLESKFESSSDYQDNPVRYGSTNGRPSTIND
jgi:hypothetical protein